MSSSSATDAKGFLRYTYIYETISLAYGYENESASQAAADDESAVCARGIKHPRVYGIVNTHTHTRRGSLYILTSPCGARDFDAGKGV